MGGRQVTLVLLSLLSLAVAPGCASSRRAALHLDPQAAYTAALAQHGGIPSIPSATVAASLRQAVLIVPFEDHTLAPSGSFLDDRSGEPMSAVYVVPDVVRHLADHTAFTLKSGGATVYRAYDLASARTAEGVTGRPIATLEVELKHFELHRWVRSRPVPTRPETAPIDVVRVEYRYRWRTEGRPVEHEARHELLISPEHDALDVVSKHLVREVVAHAAAPR
ncbi:hypothetical protein L6R52_16685 [Myxococcota bacterium]|nr:hypothetical protein [Myxococcota bacterium]